MLTALAFLAAIGMLVTVHEYGHYRVAKACGVKVLTFSIGFGKPLLQWQRGETRWQIALVPLGGFVRMLGEEEGASVSPGDEARAYNRQSPWRKMAIVVAGPLANLLLAWLLFSLALAVGSETLKPVVGGVGAGSLAERTGLHPGDEIVRLAGRPVRQWDDLRLAALDAAGESSVDLLVRAADGHERALLLDLSQSEGKNLDLRILERMGLSPFPLLNRIGYIEPGGVAELAGLRMGDVISAVNATPVARWESLQALIAQKAEVEVVLTVLRDGEEMRVRITPRAIKVGQDTVGRIGVGAQVDAAVWASQKIRLQLTPLQALVGGAQEMRLLAGLTYKFFGAMLTGQMSASNVSGPVGIASMAGESASLGLMPYVKFLALLSLSLGLLNLLPVPVLDGGHLLYHVAELVRGRAVPVRWQEIGQRVGIVLLIALMVLALYNDINRLING